MEKMRCPLLHLLSTVLTANSTELQKPQEYVVICHQSLDLATARQHKTTVWLTVIKYLH